MVTNPYIVRIKKKGYKVWDYVNPSVIIPKNELEDNMWKKESFLLDQETASKLALVLMGRKEEIPIESIAIVEVISQRPYSEMNVVMYKELY